MAMKRPQRWLVYSVLARQGTRSVYLVWLAVVALVTSSLWLDSLDQLLLAVTVIDGALFVVLLALSLHRTREGATLLKVSPEEPIAE